MSDKMQKGHFTSTKLKVLPNFISSDFNILTDFTKDNYYLYVGRLSEEKGIKILLEAASDLPYILKIAGTGPLFDALKKQYSDNKQIEFLGFQSKENVSLLISKSLFSVIPSQCYENNPLSGIESLCLGTPLLGADIGGIPELINNKSGHLFESQNVNDLKSKIIKMFNSKYDYKSDRKSVV